MTTDTRTPAMGSDSRDVDEVRAPGLGDGGGEGDPGGGGVAPAAVQPRLAAVGVSKSFGAEPVLRRLDLEVRLGETLAVLGASGSGKTTLLRIVAGLETPDEGEVYIDGRLVSDPGWALAPHERGTGFAFQSSALWPHMTVAGNVAFGLGNLPREQVRARVTDVLLEMELDGLADRYPDQLSGGQARRVGLARALAPEPRLLLLDEPLTNIEPELKERLLGRVRQRAESGRACLVYVTHDAGEATAIGGTISVLRDGRLGARDPA